MATASDEELAAAARTGDEAALEALVRRIQDPLYRLAIRMLGDADEAKDALQEALTRIVTHLGTFRGESAFRTWAYRVAANQYLNHRRKHPHRAVSFDQLAELIDAGVEAATDAAVDPNLALEMRLACTQGMLECLDRDHRIAFILGEILELDGPEAAAVLQIGTATFRKRLQRARSRLGAFMQARCGVYDGDNACRCGRQVPFAAQVGALDPARPRFIHLPVARDPERAELQNLLDVAAVLRSHPQYVAPDLAAELRRIVAPTRN